MNTDVFILFFNAILTTVASSAIVIWILRKQYLPVIRELEKSGSANNHLENKENININQ